MGSFFTKLLLLLPIIGLSTACTEKKALGTAQNPVKLYFTPSVDSETITTNSREFVNFLEKETGLKYKTGIPTNYISVVEAFGSKRADIGVMNSFGYLLAHNKYGAEAKLRVIRHGLDYYQGQIVARADSGIKTLKDLNGRKFAFTDPSSTSGYMFPLKAMNEAGVKPANSTFGIKHDNVISMIYQGQVEAGATFYSPPSKEGKIRDARARVKTQFPDVEEKIKIIHITEKIPNDPFVFRKDLPKEITTSFISAVKKYLSTKEGKEAFERIYSVEGVVDTSDADYAGLQNTIDSLGINKEKLLQ